MNNSLPDFTRMRTTVAGRFLYHCLPWRRRIVMQNIHQVYGDSLTHAQKVQLAKSFYSHMATSLREMVLLRFISEKALRARVEVRGHERMLAVAAEGRGVLVLTGHVGNWEFAPLGGILNFEQFRGQFHFIRRTLGARWIERILFRRYYQAGLQVIPKSHSLAKVQDALAENHAVIFVMDQHASVENRDGVAVEFFGRKAGTYRSLAMFARHTGVPVVPASGYRLPDGRHVLEFHEPLYWQDYPDAKDAIYQNTRIYNEALERIILAHPEQWMWLHRRWKLKDA